MPTVIPAAFGAGPQERDYEAVPINTTLPQNPTFGVGTPLSQLIIDLNLASPNGEFSFADVGAQAAFLISLATPTPTGHALNVNDGGDEGQTISFDLPTISTNALSISDITVLKPVVVDGFNNVIGQSSSNNSRGKQCGNLNRQRTPANRLHSRASRCASRRHSAGCRERRHDDSLRTRHGIEHPRCRHRSDGHRLHEAADPRIGQQQRNLTTASELDAAGGSAAQLVLRARDRLALGLTRRTILRMDTSLGEASTRTQAAAPKRRETPSG